MRCPFGRRVVLLSAGWPRDQPAAHRRGLGAQMGMEAKLPLVWIFYLFNAAYSDITTLYYSVFINHKPMVHYTQLFLLAAAVLVEISIVMIVLSRLLEHRANRRANIGAGIFLTVVQAATL